MKTDTAFPGIITLAGLALILAAIALLSSSCTTDYPVTLSVQGEQGRVGYSAKRGLEIEIVATK